MGTLRQVLYDEDTDRLVYKAGSGGVVRIADDVFGESGADAATGLVPNPGSAAGSTRYLCEDGTWSVPSGGGGGSSDHATLSHLSWTASAHTGTASTVAGFDGSGIASLYVLATSADTTAGHLVQASDTRLSDSRAPSGAAGGDLTGTYPSPTVGSHKITDAKLRQGAATSVIGNAAGSAADVADIAASTNGTLLGRLAGALSFQSIATWLAQILTAKGDLLTYTTTPVRKAVGTDAQILVADSAQADGLRWTDRYSIQVITASGYTTVTLPTDCRSVRFTTVGSAAGGGGGTTGDNTAARAGGGGGGTGGFCQVEYRRDVLPGTVYAYVAAGAAAGTPGFAAGAGLISLVEMTNTSYAGTTTPQYSSTLAYSGGRPAGGAQGILGGGGGTAGTTPATSGSLWLHMAQSSPTLFAGAPGQTGGASGSPATYTAFFSTAANFGGGCGGAGKNTTPTAAAGGGYAANGHFAAINGGTSPGGNGANGTFGAGATVDALAYSFGGTGGGSHTAGAGGTGGNGAIAAAGGGGGAGTTSGGNGGSGGAGYVLVECFG